MKRRSLTDDLLLLVDLFCDKNGNRRTENGVRVKIVKLSLPKKLKDHREDYIFLSEVVEFLREQSKYISSTMWFCMCHNDGIMKSSAMRRSMTALTQLVIDRYGVNYVHDLLYENVKTVKTAREPFTIDTSKITRVRKADLVRPKKSRTKNMKQELAEETPTPREYTRTVEVPLPDFNNGKHDAFTVENVERIIDQLSETALKR